MQIETSVKDILCLALIFFSAASIRLFLNGMDICVIFISYILFFCP